MTPRPTTRNIQLTLLTIGEGDCGVPSTFRYDPRDPYAVIVGMSLDGCRVEWLMGRELLQDGLSDVTGEGDVCVHPGFDDKGAPVVHLELSSPDGDAVLMVPAGELRKFLAASYRSVPAGTETEFLDMDAALAELLADR